MFDAADQAISRRQLFTEAFPRALVGMARRLLQARQAVAELAATEAAPLYRWAGLSPGLKAAMREVDEMEERMRREHPEWYPEDLPQLPDISDRGAVTS